jgi:hypothetical protein
MAHDTSSISAFDRSWIRGLTLAVLLFAFWVAIKYAGQPILEQESFRQTETALTAYWMIKEGWRLAYETPGWGYPWSVPIEFPIHQTLVALIVWATGLPLEPVGRLVSFFFLLACAWPAFQISQRLHLPREAAWVFCALLWSSPLYLYWGRTFIVETAAFFFTLAALPYILDLRGAEPSWQSATLAAFWATLGMLQKSITTGPTLLVFAVVLLAPSLRCWPPALTTRRILLFTYVFVVPLAIGVAWTLYADSIKQSNIVGRALTLDFRLSTQYMGSIGQRVNPSALKEIFWDRIIKQNAGGLLGVTMIIGALWAGSTLVRRYVAICLVVSIVPIILFFEVSLMLDYYQVSSVAFLLAALTICCVVWFPTMTHLRHVVPFVTSVLVCANLVNFWLGYGKAVRSEPDWARTRTLMIGDLINRYTPKDSGIVVLGLYSGLASISPEIPYFAQRKGFTVPDWVEHKVQDDPASYLGNKELGAIVFCSPKQQQERYNRIISRYSASSEPHLFRVRNCYVWLPLAQAVVLVDGTKILPQRFIE